MKGSIGLNRISPASGLEPVTPDLKWEAIITWPGGKLREDRLLLAILISHVP